MKAILLTTALLFTVNCGMKSATIVKDTCHGSTAVDKKSGAVVGCQTDGESTEEFKARAKSALTAGSFTFSN